MNLTKNDTNRLHVDNGSPFRDGLSRIGRWSLYMPLSEFSQAWGR